MAMYVELFRCVVKYRYEKGKLDYEKFKVLHRQIVLAEYEFKGIYDKIKKRRCSSWRY